MEGYGLLSIPSNWEHNVNTINIKRVGLSGKWLVRKYTTAIRTSLTPHDALQQPNRSR